MLSPAAGGRAEGTLHFGRTSLVEPSRNPTVLRDGRAVLIEDPNSSVNNLGETLAWTTRWRHDCETR
jgi:hypothetical protein